VWHHCHHKTGANGWVFDIIELLVLSNLGHAPYAAPDHPSILVYLVGGGLIAMQIFQETLEEHQGPVAPGCLRFQPPKKERLVIDLKVFYDFPKNSKLLIQPCHAEAVPDG